MRERGGFRSANGGNNELRGIMRIFDHSTLSPLPPHACVSTIECNSYSVYIWTGQGHVHHMSVDAGSSQQRGLSSGVEKSQPARVKDL